MKITTTLFYSKEVNKNGEKKRPSIFDQAQTRIDASSNGKIILAAANEEFFKTEIYPEILRMKERFIETELPPIYFPLTQEISDFIGKGVPDTTFYFTYHDGQKNEVDIKLLADPNLHRLAKGHIDSLAKIWNTEDFNKYRHLLTGIYVTSKLGPWTDLSFRVEKSYQHREAKFVYYIRSGSFGVDLESRSIEAPNPTEEGLNKFVEEILQSLKRGDHIPKNTEHPNLDTEK